MAEKSVQYPKVTWNECIEFVKTVSSFNLKVVSYTEVAKKYGLTSPTAKSFTSKLSTCKQFGLLTTSAGSTIQLTETCKRILFPTGEDITPIIRTCFEMPPLYKKLIALYDGKAIPGVTSLANILMNDHRIQKSVKDNAAKAFVDSAEQLGLIQGGILCFSADDNSENTNIQREDFYEAEATADMPATTQPISNPITVPVNLTSSESDYITQTIPFESGKVARFIIPVDATEDDLMLLHDMLDVLLKRKFKLNI